MSFSILSSREHGLERRQEGSERPLATRLAFFILPASLLLCLLAAWLGFRAASSTLEESLPTVPLLEAKIHAEKFEKLLESLSRGLFQIAQIPEHNPQTIREKFPAAFHDFLPFVAEFGLNAKGNTSFLFLRDPGGNLVPVSLAVAAQDPYAPFAQIAMTQLRPGRVTLLPAVLARYALTPDQPQQSPIMRLALPLDKDRGTLVLGLDLERLHAMLAVYMGADSPLRTPMQEDNLQFAFFFDYTGWILFELGAQPGAGGFFPDAARRGYEGDVGRPGFDAAFRPLSQHEMYWQMAADVREGKVGFIPLSPRHYPASHTVATTYLCYAPVRFSPTPGEAATQIVGGIAFLEASQLPITAFYRAAATAVAIFALAVLTLVLVVRRAGRKLGVPFRDVATQLQSMLHTGQLAPLKAQPVCEEQQVLLEAGNELITRNMALQADLARMQAEMHQAWSIMPVDLEDVLGSPSLHENFGLVGSSLAMQEVREEVHKAGRSGADVLICGETGTGKELVAAAIHQTGVSTEGAFISINCGALDENLLQDTLFGHVKGAFSEAKSDRKGAFLAAEGGTLFLDEIANASLKVQQALLRALSIRRIRPLGTDVEIPFVARVVTATNVDLLELVRRGLFREDLYYRLAIINIDTPTLRQRKEDIPELAAYFIHEAGKRLTRSKVRLSRGALEAMMEHSWPGNVRELKNCITRAMAFMEGDLILRQHILIETDPFLNPRPLRRENGNGLRSVLPAQVSVLPPVDSIAAPADIFTPPSSPPLENDPAAPATPAAAAGRETAAHAPTHPPQTHVAMPGLNDRQMLALQHMRKNGGITRSEYEKLTDRDISARTMQNDLRMLIDLGVIRRVGGGPKTRYILRQHT